MCNENKQNNKNTNDIPEFLNPSPEYEKPFKPTSELMFKKHKINTKNIFNYYNKNDCYK